MVSQVCTNTLPYLHIQRNLKLPKLRCLLSCLHACIDFQCCAYGNITWLLLSLLWVWMKGEVLKIKTGPCECQNAGSVTDPTSKRGWKKNRLIILRRMISLWLHNVKYHARLHFCTLVIYLWPVNFLFNTTVLNMDCEIHRPLRACFWLHR